MTDSGVFHQDDRVTVHHGDALDVLRSLPDCSVDAVVTDPPYGLEFMGKEWDRFSGAVTDRDFKGFVLSQQRTRNVKCPECGRWAYDHPGRLCECGGIRRAQGSAYQQWCEAWAAECLRVLKPGGHLLAFGGTRTYHRLTCAIEDAGFEVRDQISWLYGQGFPKSHNLDGEQAGWGTALKPAHEPVVVARKPLPGTVAANVLAHGVGALNVAGCRVPHADEADLARSLAKTPGRRDKVTSGTYGADRPQQSVNTDGRWPTNVVVDDQVAADLGEASRVFPVFRYEAKAPTSERPRAGGAAHPTVKPLDLMRWLVRLVTPPGGLVLDPFAGSGTTAEACIVEGFRCVAVEREAAYLPLIVARLSKPIQPVLDL